MTITFTSFNSYIEWAIINPATRFSHGPFHRTIRVSSFLAKICEKNQPDCPIL